ncbi:His-Xaa-Ser system radical SAM maturase HxsC [Rhodobacter ferrooxidans]|uniref:His-Xaa-Ser system radical SAM maturase HxsC n=1 Tax=Rhodobacter ferrooxidans TaxID=371731 RepID=UPI0018DBB9AE|nr:His-Xaa-Ser system radical SAM maturase HxsC [Rhodobacter sp. SW2]
MWLTRAESSHLEFDVQGFTLSVKIEDPSEIDGDVVLMFPQQTTLHRLIRANSAHNTLLVTEQCDQACIMCSQPPKKRHADMFGVFSEALQIAPFGAAIGISGGEPLLHKEALFSMLLNARRTRPDLLFHVLTNGQHFDKEDMKDVEELDPKHVLWGIPLYSENSCLHDRIVKKNGAFARLMESLALLGRSGARIELRTVLLRSNVAALEDMAVFVSRNLAFIDYWAIMQMENIGFGRRVWKEEFFDNSANFAPIARALDTADIRGIETTLYNFPLCSVPEPYRRRSLRSISDWKNVYMAQCGGCSARPLCSGFFAWHPKNGAFSKLGAI